MTGSVEDRLREACRTGDNAALADWATTGRPGLLLLRDYLSGEWDPGPMDGHPRDLIDNLRAAVAATAAAHPQEFLDVFGADRFLDSGYVLTGLGQIDDPRATERLVRAAASRDNWNRMDAAIGLGRRPAPAATETLGRLLGDDEYLVRYHALASLARIGDSSVLPLLRGWRPPSPYEAKLVEGTIAAILARSDEGRVTR
jgi:hypothetical protein